MYNLSDIQKEGNIYMYIFNYFFDRKYKKEIKRFLVSDRSKGFIDFRMIFYT